MPGTNEDEQEQKVFKEFNIKLYGIISQFVSSINSNLALEIMNIGSQGKSIIHHFV